MSVTSLFTVQSVMKGFDHELRSMLRGSFSDITVYWGWQFPEVQEFEKALPEGVVASPVIHAYGLLRTGAMNEPVSVRGVEPDRATRLRKNMDMKDLGYSKLSTEEKTPVLGELNDLFGSTEEIQGTALIGKVLAEMLGIGEGDLVELELTHRAGGIGRGTFKVADVFHSGLYEDDSSTVYVSIGALRRVFDLPDKGYSYLEVAVGMNDRAEVLSHIRENWSESRSWTWEERRQMRLRAIKQERMVMMVILSLIVVVSSFSILAVQWNFVQEKVKDIGILRAVGMSKMSIFAVFMGTGWLVGCTGLLLGFAGGIGLSMNLNELIAMTGWDPFPTDIYYHSGLPVRIDFSDLIWISLLGFGVTTLAGFFPAAKAVQVEPIEAMRAL